MNFPPDKDLGPDAVSVASVILPRHGNADVKRIVNGLRAEYERREARGPADVIVMAVPAGSGLTFLEGLAEALKANGQFRGTVGL